MDFLMHVMKMKIYIKVPCNSRMVILKSCQIGQYIYILYDTGSR